MGKSCLIFTAARLVISWMLETFTFIIGCSLITPKKKENSDTQICSGVTLRLFTSKTSLAWKSYLTRKRLTAVILLLVRKDFPCLGFPHMIPTSNEGECLLIDCSTYMYYASWPVSAPVQIQYTFKSLVYEISGGKLHMGKPNLPLVEMRTF